MIQIPAGVSMITRSVLDTLIQARIGETSLWSGDVPSDWPEGGVSGPNQPLSSVTTATLAPMVS
jgi:hypothetical protein